jgi:hypothetical protein
MAPTPQGKPQAWWFMKSYDIYATNHAFIEDQMILVKQRKKRQPKS